MYLLPNISIRKRIRKLLLSKRFFILMLILCHTYIGLKIEFLIFNSVFLKPKHKTYILSKKVLLRICRMSEKLAPPFYIFKKMKVVLNCATFVLHCVAKIFLKKLKLEPKYPKNYFFTSTAILFF